MPQSHYFWSFSPLHTLPIRSFPKSFLVYSVKCLYVFQLFLESFVHTKTLALCEGLGLGTVYSSFLWQHWSKTHTAVHINKFNYQKSYFNLSRRNWSSLMFYSSCHNKWFHVSWMSWPKSLFRFFIASYKKKPEQILWPTQYNKEELCEL